MTGEVKHLVVNHNGLGDNELLPAKANVRYVVCHFLLVAAGAVTVRFESGAGGTALTGVMSLAANAILAPSFSSVSYFQTLPNQTLNMELGGAVAVAGWLSYYEVSALSA